MRLLMIHLTILAVLLVVAWLATNQLLNIANTVAQAGL